MLAPTEQVNPQEHKPMSLASHRRSVRPVALTLLILFAVAAQPLYRADTDIAARGSCTAQVGVTVPATCSGPETGRYTQG